MNLTGSSKTTKKSTRQNNVMQRIKGYKSPNDKNGTKHVFLEGEECKAHVGKYEVLRQKVQDLKQLQQNIKS